MPYQREELRAARRAHRHSTAENCALPRLRVLAAAEKRAATARTLLPSARARARALCPNATERIRQRAEHGQPAALCRSHRATRCSKHAGDVLRATKWLPLKRRPPFGAREWPGARRRRCGAMASRQFVVILTLLLVPNVVSTLCAPAQWLDRVGAGDCGDWAVILRFEPAEACAPSVPPVLRRLFRLGVRRLSIAARQGAEDGTPWDGPPGLDVAVEWSDARSAEASRAAVAALAGKLGCASARSVADGLQRLGCRASSGTSCSEHAFISGGGVCGDSLRAWMDLVPPQSAAASVPGAFKVSLARLLSVDASLADDRLVDAKLVAAAVLLRPVPPSSLSTPPRSCSRREHTALQGDPTEALRVQSKLAQGRVGSSANPWRHHLTVEATVPARVASLGGRLALFVALPGFVALEPTKAYATLRLLQRADADPDSSPDLATDVRADVQVRGWSGVVASVALEPGTVKESTMSLRLLVDLAASVPLLDDAPFSASRGLEVPPPLAEWVPHNRNDRTLRVRFPGQLRVRVPLGDEAMPYNVMGIAGVLTTAPLAAALGRLTRCEVDPARRTVSRKPRGVFNGFQRVGVVEEGCPERCLEKLSPLDAWKLPFAMETFAHLSPVPALHAGVERATSRPREAHSHNAFARSFAALLGSAAFELCLLQLSQPLCMLVLRARFSPERSPFHSTVTNCSKPKNGGGRKGAR